MVHSGPATSVKFSAVQQVATNLRHLPFAHPPLLCGNGQPSSWLAKVFDAVMRVEGYGRPGIMAWCEANKVDYVFGLPGNRTLHADPVIVAAADAVCVERATRGLPVLRRYAETRYTAKSWAAQSWGDTGRRVVARIEASTLGLDIRFVVTSLKAGSAEHSYDTRYCARGQAETLIKMHKSQLKSDRTSCRCANANQMRLILHTAACWLMWSVRQALP
jgi:hypothetical protein